MKKLLLTILLMMTATVIIAKSKEIKVSTPEEFIKAIGSNRIITVSGIINLSDVLQSNEKAKRLVSQPLAKAVKLPNAPRAKMFSTVINSYSTSVST